MRSSVFPLASYLSVWHVKCIESCSEECSRQLPISVSYFRLHRLHRPRVPYGRYHHQNQKLLIKENSTGVIKYLQRNCNWVGYLQWDWVNDKCLPRLVRKRERARGRRWSSFSTQSKKKQKRAFVLPSIIIRFHTCEVRVQEVSSLGNVQCGRNVCYLHPLLPVAGPVRANQLLTLVLVGKSVTILGRSAGKGWNWA